MNVYERIVELLKEEPLLKDFKYVKSKSIFVKKVDNIHYILDLYHVFTFNFWVNVYPTTAIRYDILHKWFEKFSFRTVRDQRNTYTSGTACWPQLLGLESCYSFLYSEEDFDEVYPQLLQTVRCLIQETFPKFTSLKDFYDRVIAPVLTGESDLPNLSADWVFEYLSATKIVAPDKYEEVKKVVMSHVKEMTAKGEPNLIEYVGKWDEIFAYLESLDFSSGKAREPKTESKRKRQPKKEV